MPRAKVRQVGPCTNGGEPSCAFREAKYTTHQCREPEHTSCAMRAPRQERVSAAPRVFSVIAVMKKRSSFCRQGFVEPRISPCLYVRTSRRVEGGTKTAVGS